MTQHKENIIRLYNEGKSYRQIKKELGCSIGTISYHVGIGQKEKTSERRAKQVTNVRKFIQEYKQGKECADCKERYPYFMMDFDHLGNKEFSISSFNSKTVDLEKIKEEIEKCEVVCANCHRMRTFVRSLTTSASALDISEFYE